MRGHVAQPIRAVLHGEAVASLGQLATIGGVVDHVDPLRPRAREEVGVEREQCAVLRGVLQPRGLFGCQLRELGTDERQQLLAVLVAAANHLRMRETRGDEPFVQRRDTANLAHHQVGGRVVAGNHHLGDQVAVGRRQAEVVILQHAAAVAQVGAADRDARVQVERLRVNHLERANHNRKLDDAGAAERLVAAHRGFLAGAQVFDVQAGPCRKVRQLRFEQLREVTGWPLRGHGTGEQH